MDALLQLTVANIRSFVRDRAALFWTLAFPLIFILMFGAIFSGGGNQVREYGWVDHDASPESAQLRAAFDGIPNVDLVDGTEAEVLDRMRSGDVRAVLVVPDGYAERIAQIAADPSAQAIPITVYTDPAQSAEEGDTLQVVNSVFDAVSLAIRGGGPVLAMSRETIQTQELGFISYLVPSILGMALMQLGVFSAIPLVADREKLILKRLSATPLRRWQLVGSNVIMRLLIAIVQTLIIVGVGVAMFGVEVAGNVFLIGALVVLGSLAFIALGYVIASFAKTEESANGMTSVVQFPLMFLSGTFFPIEAMPEILKMVARAMPLTYLSDALRQTMVGGAAFVPLWVCFAILAGFLVVCFGISARFFRWQ
jgi:ABC-2 type transport system permease protein